MLSKTCSSDAYYYINKDTVDPEAEVFVPVLLRKSAVAWNISYVIEVLHDVRLMEDKCSRGNRIRLRRSLSGREGSLEKAYFMYDFPADHSRHIGICVEWNGQESLAHLSDDDAVFNLRVEFTNIAGARYWQEQVITKRDVINALNQKETDPATMAAACKHEVQMISGDILQSAAEHVKAGERKKSKDVMLQGKQSLQALMEEYGAKAQESTTTENKASLVQFAASVVENLGALVETIEEASTGESWNKMKAVSTAVAREMPNTNETLLDGGVLCPLPEVEYKQSTAMSDPLRRLRARHGRPSAQLQ